MTNDEIQAELCALKDRAYNEQPDTFSVLVDLIDLLNSAHCDHDYETINAGGDPTNPPEAYQACRKCGHQKQ